MLLKNKYITKFLILQLFLLFVICLLYNNLNVLSVFTKKILEFFFLFIVIESVYVNSLIYRTWKNFDNLFIGMFVFFLGSRVILNLFSNEFEIEYFEFFINRYVSISVLNRAIFNLIISLICYNIGSMIYKINSRHRYYNDAISYFPSNVISDKYLYTIIAVGFLAKFYFLYQILLEIISKGYLSLFIGEISINRNLILMFLEAFYEIGIFLLISQNKKLNKLSYFIIFSYPILSLSTGQRGLALLSFIFILFYMYKLGRIKIKLIWSLLNVVFLVLLSVFIGYARDSNEFVIQDIGQTFFDFFYGQGISLSVIVATIDYNNYIDYSFLDLFGHIRYLIEYYWGKLIFNPIKDVDLTLQAEEYKWYGQYISSILNQDMYYMGLGLGSSYIAQFYAIGKEFAQILGGIFVGYISSYLYSLLHSKKIFNRFFSFHVLILFIFIPRANLFDPITFQWSVIIVSIILFYCFKSSFKMSNIHHV